MDIEHALFEEEVNQGLKQSGKEISQIS